MLGICNGFQALVKLGLVPYGEIRDEMTGGDPTLTFNLIGRHQSRYVTTRVASVKSPWLSSCEVGDLHSIAISHGEGRFVAPQHVIDDLAKNGQIAFQYTDLAGEPSMDIAWNPNGSMCAIEGITSRTAACSARWATPSVTARSSAATSMARNTSRSLKTA